jgi:alpha-1,2-glucosyltransferase
MQEATTRRVRIALAAAVIAAQTALTFQAVRGMHRYSDEMHHLRQIERFCQGDWSADPKLTVVPGYHLLSALAGRLWGDCSLLPMRAVNLGFGLLSVLVFHAAASAAGVRQPLMRTLQYYFLPVLLPYHFLVYSDSISLLALLAAMALTLRGRYGAAGVVGALSILLRQTNVVWLLFFCVYALLEEGDARRAWPFVPGILIFVVFVVWNGGVAMGDQRAHQLGLHWGNVFFLLLLFFPLFLPRCLALLWRHRERLGELPLAALLAAAFVLFLLVFGVAHPYNRFEGFLRNDLLLLVEEHPLLKAGLFVPVAGALAALWFDRLQRGVFHVLYPLALLSLLPIQLIDQRYAFVPLVFHLLLRKDDTPLVEALSLAQSVVLSAVILDGVTRGTFAL